MDRYEVPSFELLDISSSYKHSFSKQHDSGVDSYILLTLDFSCIELLSSGDIVITKEPVQVLTIL